MSDHFKQNQPVSSRADFHLDTSKRHGEEDASTALAYRLAQREGLATLAPHCVRCSAGVTSCGEGWNQIRDD
jgi:hypothetical protein